MQNYQAPANLLQDRVILVTGAGDGIGRCAAKTFAAHGATVILLGRTLSKLESVYDEIEQAGHPQPAIYPMNLEGAAPKDYEELCENIGKEFNQLDGLLHNAGILGNLTPIEQYPVELWYQVIQVNLQAPFMLTQACLPLLLQSDDASIVFTSSSVARRGRAFWGAYSVSKGATENMMQVLADELSNTTVRVNSLNPGSTRTKMRAIAYPAEDRSKLATPESLMPVYLYLMGRDSHDINGQSIDAQPKK